MPTPPASADAARNLFIASVCRRWRRLVQRHVTALLVKEDRVVSRRDVLNAVACFPHLTHLHLADGSVETLDDTFLADLASSCPGCLSSLTALSFENFPLHFEQLSNLLQLTNLIRLSLPLVLPPVSPDPPAFSLAQLPFLKSLNFRLLDLQFSVFFPLGSPYRFLKHLQLSNSLIQRLPSSIGQVLPRLQELSISGCRIFSDLTDEFTSLTCLESLTISSCRVSTMPDNFGNLPALKALVLHELPLLRLPASFTRLASLESLLLVGCGEVEGLPAGFGRLTALQTLSVAWSSTLFPEDLGGLTNLRTLYFRYSRQEQLPSSFTQLTSLTRLELDQCGIAELPEGMAEMTHLQELYIQDCHFLKELSGVVTALISLEVLRIEECNNLSSIPRRLDSLIKLTQLGVRGCYWLNEAPQALPLSLQALSFVTNEHAASLPDISTLTGLRELCLGIVDATCVEAISAHLCGVKHLELELEEDAEDALSLLARLPLLRTLTLKGVRSVNNLVGNNDSALLELRQLNIRTWSERFTELPAAITTLHHLTSIQILAPMLSSLPDGLGALSRLRKLDLSHCSSLTQLPASLTHLSCLHELNVSNTSIRLLPAGFANLSRLKKLDLDQCEQLEALPDDISDLRMLDFLSTRG
ncbi:unnamed protein product [Closterium sp. Naga37s-1]|nr:unnamed protein product [Closterium sp. Naga37s-1]